MGGMHLSSAGDYQEISDSDFLIDGFLVTPILSASGVY